MRALASHVVEPDSFAGKHQKAPGPFPLPALQFRAKHREGALLQRKANCVCGGGCPSCAEEKASTAMQTKLAVSNSGDQYEQEADRIAQQVISMPTPDKVGLRRSAITASTCHDVLVQR